SATWYKVLFPNAHLMSTYLPNGMTYNQMTICNQAVVDAIAKPFEITDLEKLIDGDASIAKQPKDPANIRKDQ
ncbi:MAG: hypothetical protein K2H18_02060, partial [Muribaculaceae bacterium]|nr:hypothetical protein [Muribaculaceae bacterium]